MAELDKVRQDKYALNDEEMAAGLRSVAAPVRGAAGQVVAAINVSVPSVRVSHQKLEPRQAPIVRDIAR